MKETEPLVAGILSKPNVAAPHALLLGAERGVGSGGASSSCCDTTS
jgi:hypothetical protein